MMIDDQVGKYEFLLPTSKATNVCVTSPAHNVFHTFFIYRSLHCICNFGTVQNDASRSLTLCQMFQCYRQVSRSEKACILELQFCANCSLGGYGNAYIMYQRFWPIRTLASLPAQLQIHRMTNIMCNCH